MITERAQRILLQMIAAEIRCDWEDAEIVAQGAEVWCGDDKLSRATLNQLLRRALVSDRGKDTGVERYALNEDGRRAAKDRAWINPALATALSLRKA